MESNEYNSGTGHRSLGRPGGWLVSLGDLLTLLLCFFIALAALGRVTPINTSQEISLIINDFPEGQVAGLEQGPPPPPGITLANYNSDQPVARLELSRSDFGADLAETTTEFQSRLKSALSAEGYQLERVLIESCAPLTTGAAAESWRLALARVLVLRSQVIDSEPSAALELRAAGPHCQNWAAAAVAEEVEALISLEWKRFSHG